MAICPLGITIGIPNWNHEYLLPRSILSALLAREKLRSHDVAVEIIVVDDGSRDGSLTLLRQLEALYYNQGLRILALKQNGGLGNARNQIMAHASYRYVLFLDADNELVPDNTFQFYRSILQTGCAVIFGNVIRVSAGSDEPDLISNEAFQDTMFSANYIDAFALVDRLQVMDCGGYSTKLMLGREDYELYLHLAVNGRRIVFVPIVFGIYHSLPGSMIEETGKRLMEDTGYSECSVHERVFNQLGIRRELPLNTRQLIYHPDIGYFEEAGAGKQ